MHKSTTAVDDQLNPDPEWSEYDVVWSIEVSAASPREAAEKARAIQRDPDSTATLFHVTDSNGRNSEEDLSEPPLSEMGKEEKYDLFRHLLIQKADDLLTRRTLKGTYIDGMLRDYHHGIEDLDSVINELLRQGFQR